jgi:hypothetical protein
MIAAAEFREIAHSGGQVTFRTVTEPDGSRKYQIGYQHSRPTPASIFAVYALQEGVAVGTVRLGGIGQPWNPPPVPGCVPVFIASDSEGQFGFQCPVCRQYWRASAAAVCAYRGVRAQRHDFLTDAQRVYVALYCQRLSEALSAEDDGEHVIDLDAVADATGKQSEKPPFYYSEQSQQNQFTCSACEEPNDILGRFGYCSACGTRNDLQELETVTFPALRNRINDGGPYDTCVKEAASAFDSFVSQYVKQLLQKIPMRPGRKGRLERMRFHNLDAVLVELRAVSDIDLCSGFKESEIAATKLMFHRRHVYEHNGGEVDEKYLADSGDTTVRLKQLLREDPKSVHNFVGFLAKMARNLHDGFHEIFPPEPGPIKEFERRRNLVRSARN